MSLVAELFDDPVVVVEADPARFPPDLGVLPPEEAAAMQRAIDKRRREFVAGRQLAREAMRALGHPEVAVPMREDRAPEWPATLVGTITHTQGWCAAALAHRGVVRAVGADVEQDTPLEERLWESIATPGELARWKTLSAPEARRLGKLVFSAKECAYKAQYLLTQQFLGFSAMRIEVEGDDARGVWRATFEQPSGEHFAVGDELQGRYLRRRGLVATAITILEPP